MGYIKFDKNELINLEYSLSKELVRSNRAGSFSCTTIIGCNTRKYHGLLICPQPLLDDQPHVLLSKVDETIIQREAEFNIGVNKYPGSYNPKGHKYVRNFSADLIPVITYRVGGVIMTRETMFVTHEERVLIKYTLVEAQSPTRIRMSPFLAFRNIHSLSKKNIYLNTKYQEIPNGIKVQMYDGYSNLYIQLSKKGGEYVHVPDWYNDIEYLEEKHRGYEYHEDLYVPGFFEIGIRKGESIIFSASTSEMKPANLSRLFNKELKKRIPRDSFENSLANASEQFFFKYRDKTGIIAGYPWYGRLGRFTFIALPGLSLGIDNQDVCNEVVDTMVKEMQGPFFRETGNGSGAFFGAADTSLWFFRVLQQCPLKKTKKDTWDRYGKTMHHILESYAAGTSNGIKMMDNGLIYIDESAPDLTWMNAKIEGKCVIPRYGYVVEVNALWYNAICFALDLAKNVNEKEFINRWKTIRDKVRENFSAVFWNKEQEGLADFVTREKTDLSVRPNQIIATSLPHSPLEEPVRKLVIDRVIKELLTPRGLRSLSPKDPLYKGKYQGNVEQRESAFHQGTAWPWLLEHFAEGFLKIYGEDGKEYIRKIYEGFNEAITENAIGTISEIYEGDPPHKGAGAISFAPSVAALIRIYHMTKARKRSEKKK